MSVCNVSRPFYSEQNFAPASELIEFNNIQEHDVHLQHRLNINILLYNYLYLGFLLHGNRGSTLLHLYEVVVVLAERLDDPDVMSPAVWSLRSHDPLVSGLLRSQHSNMVQICGLLIEVPLSLWPHDSEEVREVTLRPHHSNVRTDSVQSIIHHHIPFVAEGKVHSINAAQSVRFWKLKNCSNASTRTMMGFSQND